MDPNMHEDFPQLKNIKYLLLWFASMTALCAAFIYLFIFEE